MMKKYFFVFGFAFMVLCGCLQAKVVVYPKIKDKALVEDSRYAVYIRTADGVDQWKELQVLSVDVDMDTRSKAAMAQFDMDAPVEVKVETATMKVNEVKIRPLSRGVQSKRIDEHAFVFRLERPEKLSIEINGDRKRNLHLFANDIEKETYDTMTGDNVVRWNNGSKDIFRKDCRLIYFGPGVHQPKDLPNNEINIPSNCTVYLAPGALVKAKLRVDRAKNVKIIGRGYLFQPLRGVEITYSKNVTVDGITIINPMHYTVFGGQSKNVKINNIKSFSVRGWSDGIDLMCCQNWTINDVFLRTSDDCLAFYNHRWWYWGDSKNLKVTNTILWADVAHAMNVGGHGDDLSKKGEKIESVVFKNIDVLNVDEDDDNYRGVMSICCGDKNRVRKVLFENIRVEDCEEARLVDIRVLFNEKYNTVPGGTIENIVFRNIDYKAETGDMYPMRIKGYDEKSVVRGVFMENVVLNGTKMVSPDGIEMNAYVENVQVK